MTPRGPARSKLAAMSSTTVIADEPWQYPDSSDVQIAHRRTSTPVLIGPSAAVVALRQATVVPMPFIDPMKEIPKSAAAR